MNNTVENEEKILSLSSDVIRFSRNTILVNMRFMDAAIGRLVNYPDGEKISTDGKVIHYDPVYILKSYKRNKNFVNRLYLHSIMHCVFRHFYISTLVNEEYWDLACDIAIEKLLIDLDLRIISVPEDAVENKEILKFNDNVKYMTAEVLYRYLLDKNLPRSEFERLYKIFHIDDHEIWYRKRENGSCSNENESGNDYESNKSNGVGEDSQTSDEVIEDWKNISEKMQMDLETFSRDWGTHAGNLSQSLRELNREKYDYAAFLNKFAVMGEVMTVNEDEFDYIFYTYGLKLYKKMPLIEPLEYKEVKRIKEFVIAIDSSGSTSGDLVQAFLQKTYNILMQKENFFTKINIHIIQCDADIQQDAKITSAEEFDAYISHLEVLGHGGTDFRPVFEYVNKMILAKEFINLKGMIYFTDGCGTFPTRQPGYHTAFVFVENQFNNYDVPVWAIKLILREEEIVGDYDEYKRS